MAVSVFQRSSSRGYTRGMERTGTILRLILALAALIAAPVAAQAPALGETVIAARLVAETQTVRPGETATLALVMTPKPTWHGYWKNPGDSGMETSVAWQLPAGVKAADLQYPVPQKLVVAGLMNYVYEGEYAHLVPLHVPPDAAPGTQLPIRAKVDYLACTDEICVPQVAEVSTVLTVGTEPGERRAEFDRWRAAMPKPIGAEASFAAAGGNLRLAVPAPASLEVDEEPYFFPLTDGAIDYSAPQSVTRNGDTLIIETKGGMAAGSLQRVEGVLRIGEHDGLWLLATPGDVPAAGAAVGAPKGADMGGGTILLALLGAVAGGLLLNIMPCVFPILSLKALSLAKAGGDEAGARREALAYTAGAVAICLALGGALLALRAGGAAVGWAFQLQDPRVILVLLLLVTAIALNLAGLFELPSLAIGNRLAATGGTAGAFWTGALAAFIATPCTGPFMGAALGLALVLPVAAALAIFAGLGLGLALPFLLLGFLPGLRRKLPKPGAWMGTFRRVLSVPMFLTALGLAWILGRQAGVDGMTLGLLAALIVGLALWWTGRRGGWLPLAPAALAAVGAIVAVPATSAAPAAESTPAEGMLAAEPFSEARLAALQAEQRPVFVYFTADWCLTCKVNEKGALERQEVAEAFRARNVAVLVGDWTDGDAAIGRFLASHGRSGVPLYLYYPPGAEVEVLPQLLTPGMITNVVS